MRHRDRSSMLARAIVLGLTMLACGACAVKHTVVYHPVPLAK